LNSPRYGSGASIRVANFLHCADLLPPGRSTVRPLRSNAGQDMN
jgi:hypothetical protein